MSRKDRRVEEKKGRNATQDDSKSKGKKGRNPTEGDSNGEEEYCVLDMSGYEVPQHQVPSCQILHSKGSASSLAAIEDKQVSWIEEAINDAQLKLHTKEALEKVLILMMEQVGRVALQIVALYLKCSIFDGQGEEISPYDILNFQAYVKSVIDSFPRRDSVTPLRIFFKIYILANSDHKQELIKGIFPKYSDDILKELLDYQLLYDTFRDINPGKDENFLRLLISALAQKNFSLCQDYRSTTLFLGCVTEEPLKELVGWIERARSEGVPLSRQACIFHLYYQYMKILSSLCVGSISEPSLGIWKKNFSAQLMSAGVIEADTEYTIYFKIAKYLLTICQEIAVKKIQERTREENTLFSQAANLQQDLKELLSSHKDIILSDKNPEEANSQFDSERVLVEKHFNALAEEKLLACVRSSDNGQQKEFLFSVYIDLVKKNEKSCYAVNILSQDFVDVSPCQTDAYSAVLSLYDFVGHSCYDSFVEVYNKLHTDELKKEMIKNIFPKLKDFVLKGEEEYFGLYKLFSVSSDQEIFSLFLDRLSESTSDIFTHLLSFLDGSFQDAASLGKDPNHDWYRYLVGIFFKFADKMTVDQELIKRFFDLMPDGEPGDVDESIRTYFVTELKRSQIEYSIRRDFLGSIPQELALLNSWVMIGRDACPQIFSEDEEDTSVTSPDPLASTVLSAMLQVIEGVPAVANTGAEFFRLGVAVLEQGVASVANMLMVTTVKQYFDSKLMELYKNLVDDKKNKLYQFYFKALRGDTDEELDIEKVPDLKKYLDELFDPERQQTEFEQFCYVYLKTAQESSRTALVRDAFSDCVDLILTDNDTKLFDKLQDKLNEGDQRLLLNLVVPFRDFISGREVIVQQNFNAFLDKLFQGLRVVDNDVQALYTEYAKLHADVESLVFMSENQLQRNLEDANTTLTRFINFQENDDYHQIRILLRVYYSFNTNPEKRKAFISTIFSNPKFSTIIFGQGDHIPQELDEEKRILLEIITKPGLLNSEQLIEKVITGIDNARQANMDSNQHPPVVNHYLLVSSASAKEDELNVIISKLILRLENYQEHLERNVFSQSDFEAVMPAPFFEFAQEDNDLQILESDLKERKKVAVAELIKEVRSIKTTLSQPISEPSYDLSTHLSNFIRKFEEKKDLLSKNCDMGRTLVGIIATLLVLPAVLLAIQSKMDKSRNTFNFFKSQGSVVAKTVAKSCEYLICHRSLRVD